MDVKLMTPIDVFKLCSKDCKCSVSHEASGRQERQMQDDLSHVEHFSVFGYNILFSCYVNI